MSRQKHQHLTERKVTCTLEMDERVYIAENVPARVDLETGEEFFAPEAVQHLWTTILRQYVRCLRNILLPRARTGAA